jgi:hypothetical protein
MVFRPLRYQVVSFFNLCEREVSLVASAPILYRPDVEQMHEDEQKTIQELNSTFVILERTAKDYGHAVRSVHAKAHGIFQGEMTVHGGLPAELAQGLFASPGTHKVFLRLSTNAGDILPDAISLPRGLAMKVFDVPGERLPGARVNGCPYREPGS